MFLKNKEKIPGCCQKKSKGVKDGILSGIIPHAGCIAILLFAVLGGKIANSFFRKFLFNSYYLYIIFALSFVIAIISAFLYIRRFSDKRIKSHRKYLIVLFSSVIIINLLMIYLVFPYATNLSGKVVKGDIGEESKILKLSFDIPCSGHAPLVISELGKVEGIEGTKYISGKSFEVYYNPIKITKEQILSLDVCKEFNAKEENK